MWVRNQFTPSFTPTHLITNKGLSQGFKKIPVKLSATQRGANTLIAFTVQKLTIIMVHRYDYSVVDLEFLKGSFRTVQKL